MQSAPSPDVDVEKAVWTAWFILSIVWCVASRSSASRLQGSLSSPVDVVVRIARRSLRVVFLTRFKKVVFVVWYDLVAVLRVYRFANRCAEELDVSHT
jgi:hypothetical protein